MADEEKKDTAPQAEDQASAEAPKAAPEEPKHEPDKKKKKEKHEEELESLRRQLKDQQDQYLRLAAEYDNYRKRSQKEKDHSYSDGKAATVLKFLPVYDNLERALQHTTTDDAYKKGVEMIMTGLQETLRQCGVEPFGEAGEAFDPAMHNAVMHVEDEAFGESVIVEEFQKGFKLGDKVLRCSVVKVAN